MHRSVAEWRRRILMYFVASGNHQIRASTKKRIFASFGTHKDENTEVAFNTLLESKLIIQLESKGKKFYTIDFDRIRQIKQIVIQEIDEEKFEMIQPHPEEFKGLKLVFTSASERKNPRQGAYYYCVKENDNSIWAVLLKTRILGKATKINLGSFNDANSKISKIWNAVLIVSDMSKDGIFIRKRIEEQEPKACGNNRQPSKAAIDIFVKTGLLKVVDIKGLSIIYKRTGIKPTVQNLDAFFAELKELKKQSRNKIKT